MPVPIYPPLAFYFRVQFGPKNDVNEGSFQEVSGINIKLESESKTEGGENRFTHRFPLPPKFENLILKRGLFIDSTTTEWARKAVEEFTFSLKEVRVILLNEKGGPLRSWVFIDAYPVAIKNADLNAKDGTIAIETLELAYKYFKIIK